MKRNNSDAKGKGKQLAKPVQVLIKTYLTDKRDIDALHEIKKIAKTDVTSKAIIEAMHNYPKIVKRADGLNAELQKVNRDFERVTRDFDLVKRAFNVVMGTAPKKDENVYNESYDIDLTDDNECSVCGNDSFFSNGQCTECGTDKK